MRSERVTVRQLEQQLESVSPALDVLDIFSKLKNVGVIAEIKRASPSKGKLAEIPDSGALAIEYATGGATAVSVLTEQREFLGSLEDLAKVRASIDIPVLRKDFIANEYQVLEARALGADLVLLIAAGLTKKRLSELYKFTLELGMQALVETHDANEVAIAAEIGAAVVGINARDLVTFDTDRDLFGKLAGELPAQCIKVAESAVRSKSDVESYASFGADLVLVGEALVTGNAIDLLREFGSVSRA